MNVFIVQPPQAGPTGEYPDGKLDEHDKGEIQILVAASKEKGRVLINFGTPIDFLALTPEQAVHLSIMLQKKAETLFEEGTNVETATVLEPHPDDDRSG